MRRWYLVLLTLLLPGVVLSQENKPDQPDATALLREVAANYAHAEQANIHVEMVEESTQTSELMHDWRKTYRTVMRGSSNRFRLETRSFYGSWIQVSDGKTEWIYWLDAKSYVQHPFEGTEPTEYRAIFGDNIELSTAWETVTDLESMAAHSRDAAFLPEETITLNGRNFTCYVVRAQAEKHTSEVSFDYTFWIDKQSLLFRKVIEHNKTYFSGGEGGNVHTPFLQDKTTTYPVVELNAVVPDTSFQFLPPSGAKLVDHLEPGWARRVTPWKTSSTEIHPEPNIQLADGAGKTVPLSSYRGKPLLIDLWATWCGPCIASLLDFRKIADEYRGSGLVTISIDEDDEAQAALVYLKQHGFAWTNYHDNYDEALHAFQSGGIPTVVLIDKDGNITFWDNTGDYKAALRAQLAKMFPAAKAP